MGNIAARRVVGELVVERPGLARVFEELGVDYCCGGRVSLEEACRERGLDVGEVVAELEARGEEASNGVNWGEAGIGELVDHIEGEHHAYLRRELPRLSGLIEKVALAHGKSHPEVAELKGVFSVFRAHLEEHLGKEERVLFPYCRELEAAWQRPEFHCGSVESPVEVMMAEHEEAAEDLAAMRSLTSGYAVPEDACNTYRVMLRSLEELESDMHAHVHEENNILFPKAIAREAELE